MVGNYDEQSDGQPTWKQMWCGTVMNRCGGPTCDEPCGGHYDATDVGGTCENRSVGTCDEQWVEAYDEQMGWNL